MSLKNITVGSNNSSGVVNTIFYSFSSFIHILLHLHCKSNLINIFFISMFCLISGINSKD